MRWVVAVCMLIGLAGLMACSSEPDENLAGSAALESDGGSATPQPTEVILNGPPDYQMRAIAQDIPGFAGVAGGGPGSLDVFTTDLHIDQNALRAALIPSIFSQGQLDWEIRLIEVKYDFVQLSDWYSRVYYDIHTVDGIAYTDIQEAGPWIQVGVATEEGRADLRDVFEAADVPEDAYRIEIEQPATY